MRWKSYISLLAVVGTNLVGVSSAQVATSGPSAAETVSWLNSHVSLINHEFIGENVITTRKSWETTSGKILVYQSIRTVDLQGLSVSHCNYMGGQVCVDILGKAKSCDADQNCLDDDHTFVYLPEGASKDDANRIIKAIRRLAELKGVHLPGEDLF